MSAMGGKLPLGGAASFRFWLAFIADIRVRPHHWAMNSRRVLCLGRRPSVVATRPVRFPDRFRRLAIVVRGDLWAAAVVTWTDGLRSLFEARLTSAFHPKQTLTVIGSLRNVGSHDAQN